MSSQKKNPRYELCILIICATKHTHKTDENCLKYTEQIMNDFTVKRTIKEYFKESL